jgi:hypothetical protein
MYVFSHDTPRPARSRVSQGCLLHYTSSQGNADGKQDSIEKQDSAIPVTHAITNTVSPASTHTDQEGSFFFFPQGAYMSRGSQSKMESKVLYNKFERRIKLPPTVDRNRVTASYGMDVL